MLQVLVYRFGNTNGEKITFINVNIKSQLIILYRCSKNMIIPYKMELYR